MKNLTFFLIMAISLLFTACGSPAEEELNRDQLSGLIQEMESNFQQQLGQVGVDTAAARTMVEKAEEFARRFPRDTLAPKFLFQAANVSRGIGDFERSASLWGQIASDYENYQRAPEALFFQAFTLDNDLDDAVRAIPKYESFLLRYPKHPIARDAALLLEAAKSGKSADDMVKEFQQKQQDE